MTAAANKLQHVASQFWKVALLGGMLALLTLFAFGLKRDASFMPSALVGRTVPNFSLQSLDGKSLIKSQDLLGKPLVINFWASWCGACRQEHSALVKLGHRYEGADRVRLLGINYKDTTENAEQYLRRLGPFPYDSAVDQFARTGVDFGVFGLPETFFIDAKGIVRARHIGPLDEAQSVGYLALIGVTQ